MTMTCPVILRVAKDDPFYPRWLSHFPDLEEVTLLPKSSFCTPTFVIVMNIILMQKDAVVKCIYKHTINGSSIPLSGTTITNADQLIATIHSYLVTSLGMGTSCVWHVDGYSNDLSQVSLAISVTTCMVHSIFGSVF